MIPLRIFFRRKHLRLFFLTLVSITLYTILKAYFTKENSRLVVKTNGKVAYLTATTYLRNDAACRIPKLSPVPISIKHLINDPDPNTGNCEANHSLLFESTLDFQLIPQKSLQQIEQIGFESCCYKLISKRPGVTHDDDHQLSDRCYPVSLEGPTNIPREHQFLAIFCESHTKSKTLTNDSHVSSNLVDTHAFVPLKDNVEERIKGIDIVEDSLNVAIVGLDSLSHMNFLRSMPKSHSFLIDELNAVEMYGYNSVGYHTYSNLIVALTSRNEKEINFTCDIQRSFDNCPFIWKKFAKQGFRTVFGEDAVRNRSGESSDGIFNFGLTGFQSPPTDYYLRPFGLVAERLRKTFVDLCYGPRLAFQTLLDYSQKLAYTMGKDKRYFQFIWSGTIAHKDLNDGRLGDKHLLSTLKWFRKGGYFNQTIFILMSDHGMRWGPIMDTMQGTLELRKPLLYFVIPSWFKEKYLNAYKNLLNNSDRLTTPYDLYETLSDLVSLKQIKNSEIQARESFLLHEESSLLLSRGISLFLPIPLSRTCQMAGIEDHYCVCRDLKAVSTELPVVREAAVYAVSFIQSIITSYPQCSPLSLAAIQRANAGKGLQREDVFQIFFETAPGGASFEATVSKSRTGVWSVSGTIDRTNLYGNQSHCVQDKQVKLYCYCNDMRNLKRR